MNILINGFQSLDQIHILDLIRSDLNLNKIYIITTLGVSEELKKYYPEVRQILWEDLFWDFNAYRNAGEMLPLDNLLIDELKGCESVTLRMMDRFEFKKQFTYQKRKNLYLEHLRYWHNFLVTKNIKFFFSQNIPHEVFDFVIYKLCLNLNIKTLMFYQSQINDMILPIERIEDGIINFSERYDFFKLKYQNNPGILPLHSELLNVDSNRIPFYMGKLFFWNIILGKIRDVYKNIIKNRKYYRDKLTFYYLKGRLRTGLSAIFNLIQTSLLRIYYNGLAVKPFFKKDFIYLPLHYQPELTTSPLAGNFVDQGLIIEMIASVLPENMILFVKEHPKQTCIGRDSRFYKKYGHIPKVKFIKSNYNSFELINKCYCLATATGTAGWEALVRNKPVLVFGSIFYEKAPGAYRINSIKDLVLAFERIKETSGIGNSTEDLNIFIKALEETTIKGFSDLLYKKISNYSVEESNKNMAEYIIKYLT